MPRDFRRTLGAGSLARVRGKMVGGA